MEKGCDCREDESRFLGDRDVDVCHSARGEARGCGCQCDREGNDEVEEAEEAQGPADGDFGDQEADERGEDETADAGAGEHEANCAAAVGGEIFGRDAEDGEVEH